MQPHTLDVHNSSNSIDPVTLATTAERSTLVGWRTPIRVEVYLHHHNDHSHLPSILGSGAAEKD